MPANDEQVGGTHYKGQPIEHWDFALMHDMPYMEAQIFKYVLRWKQKNGISDLRKAQHFLRKLIEWNTPTIDAANREMNPDSGEPRGQGYVNQD